MMTSYSIWTSLQSYCNFFQGSWYRPVTDFIPALNDISKEIWEEKTAKAEKSQENKDHLAPFSKSKNLIVKPQSSIFGLLEYPIDYGRLSSARIIVHNDTCVPCADVDGGKCANGNFKTQEEVTDEYLDNIEQAIVEVVDNQKWAACLSHLTKKPTLSKPKMTQYQTGWNVAPRKVSVVVLDYYVKPREATFKYTITPGNPTTGAGDFLVYDDSSISLEWPDTLLPEFVIRLGQRFGLFTRDQFVAQFATQQRQNK